MKEYLTYEEKCILLASINHERKYADNLIQGEKLLKTCDQLDYKFMYDRLFKQIRADAIDEVLKRMGDYEILLVKLTRQATDENIAIFENWLDVVGDIEKLKEKE